MKTHHCRPSPRRLFKQLPGSLAAQTWKTRGEHILTFDCPAWDGIRLGALERELGPEAVDADTCKTGLEIEGVGHPTKRFLQMDRFVKLPGKEEKDSDEDGTIVAMSQWSLLEWKG